MLRNWRLLASLPFLAGLALFCLVPIPRAFGYVEAPHSLGQVIALSSNIVVMRVTAVDRTNNRIQVFDADGRFLTVWKESGAPFGLFLAGDRLFVADGRANWVRILDADGKPIGRFGEKGTAAGQFQLPHMLCVDSRGSVYVAEVNGKRVQKFEPGKE